MKIARRLLAAGAVAGICFALPGAASAKERPEPTPVPCQTEALIGAIVNANAAGGGSLDLSPGCRYTLSEAQPDTDSGLPPIAAPIRINGQGAVIVRSAASVTPEFRVFEVLGAPAKLTIRQVTIMNGASIGDQVPGDGHSGGGILVRETGGLSADGIIVTENSGFAGGVHNYGTAYIKNSIISRNTGAWGAGLNNTGGKLYVTRTAIRDNVTESDIGVGGGIYTSEGATTNVKLSLITGNVGVNNGGGFHNEGTLNVIGSRISDNRAASLFGAPVTVQGGGIYNTGAARIVRTSIDHNQSQRQESPSITTAIAGGLSNDGSENEGVTMTLLNSRVVDNISADGPGGIANNNASISLLGTLVTRNSPTNCEGSPSDVPGCVG